MKPTLSPGQQALAYLVGIGVAESVGGLGSAVVGPSALGWYATLAKPSWTPASWLFGLVWTVLFALVGAAAARAWLALRGSRAGRVALVLFAVNVLLNGAWAVAFFALRSPLAGLLCTVAAWCCAAALARRLRLVEPVAALLLVPYLAWVGYAVVLGTAIWLLN